MYSVDSKDEVVELTDIPQSSVGAPIPVVLTDEHLTMVAYYIQEDIDDEEAIAIICFNKCLSVMFGPPNDEAFKGHPLSSRGLRPYSSFVIENSSWLRGLEKMNSVHPYHSPKLFEAYRHFVLSFHDSTFECIAVDYKYEIIKGKMAEAIDRMKAKLCSL